MVAIPNSVTDIKVSAFSECTSLATVTNHAETPQVIWEVFRDVEITACTLYVPASSVALYQAAAVWKDFGKIEAIPNP